MRVAVVHEWLTKLAGSEKVVQAALELHPDAPLYTLIHDSRATRDTELRRHAIHTSFLDSLPFSRSKWRLYLPLMPLAVEQFDLSDYDLVLSSNHCVAKGILTRADQLHISYVHTPMRYAWDLHGQYLRESGLGFGPRGLLARAILHRLRQWDVLAANRVDVFVANSRTVARRIWKTYRRRAHVIYPPVDVNRFVPDRPREEFYLAVSRFVPYKRMDLIVQAFRESGRPLVVIGDGPDESKVRALAGPNVTFLGRRSDEVVADHMQRCRAFVFAADEDFGITPVEAQAAGAPVIAYGAGGVTESVVPGQTGLFFPQQTSASLVDAIKQFEATESRFDPAALRANAERFSKPRFQRELSHLIDRCWSAFTRSRRALPGPPEPKYELV